VPVDNLWAVAYPMSYIFGVNAFVKAKGNEGMSGLVRHPILDLQTLQNCLPNSLPEIILDDETTLGSGKNQTLGATA
jgi:hypothetical protein